MAIRTAFRHYGLYLWKNAVQKKRNGGSTFCEIIAPLVVVGFLVALSKNKEVPTATFECGMQSTHGAKYDFAYLPRALNFTDQILGIVGDDRMLFYEFLQGNYPGFPNVTENVKLLEKFQCQNRWDVPLVPKWSKDNFKHFSTEDDLKSYIEDEDYGRKKKKPALFAAIVFNGTKTSYTIRMNMTDTPDTHSFTDDLARDLNTDPQELYMSPDPWDSYANKKNALSIAMPGFAQIQTAVNKFIIDEKVVEKDCSQPDQQTLYELMAFSLTWQCSALYDNVHEAFRNGTVTKLTQQACENISKGLLNSTSRAPQDVGVAPFPISAFHQNRVYQYTENTFSILFIISFLFPAFRLIQSIVHEKETKIREGMKMMGMSEFSLFAAWFTTYITIFAIIAIGISVLTSWNVFGHTNGGLLFLFFWLFGAASTALCFLLSVFFSRAKVAAVVGSVLFIATFFPYYAVNGDHMAYSSKSWASLLAPVAFGLNLDVLATTESNGVGITATNLYSTYHNYNFGQGLFMLVVDFVLYTVLAWYLDQVVPSEFGVRRPWYFIFLRDYWCGKSHSITSDNETRSCKDLLACRRPVKGEKGERLLDDMDDIGDSEIAMGEGPKFEPVGQHLKATEEAGKVIRVRNLRKEFPTPDGTKVAVENLDLTMYEGQIFALLGHNGAGKSTSISMLSGLIAPSSGSATIYGMDISSELADIRKQMGVCPQHDVLWPDLTVNEHLQYFAGIKGVPRKEVDKAVKDTIAEVGLREKVNTLTAELSGGQKRKLSVGIALIGGSKVVFLDEPTSGMDPYSRRSTWNTLQNARQGRIMILTTHFMDEADLLGDRIAIMSDGIVQCCGSSMFLKQEYGVGYNLTMVKESGCNPENLKRTIGKYIDQSQFELLSDVGTEIAFQLPMGASKKFPFLLKDIEDNRSRLRIYNFGIGVTTLEEVFLKVAEQGAAKAAAREAHKDEKQLDTTSINGMANILSSLGESLGNIATTKKSSSTSSEVMMRDMSGRANRDSDAGFGSINTRDEHQTGGWVDDYKRPEEGFEESMFFTHFKTLLKKRWNVAKRDKRALVFQLLIPILALLAGLLLLKFNPAHNPPAISLSPTNFNSVVKPSEYTQGSVSFSLRGDTGLGGLHESHGENGGFNVIATNNSKTVNATMGKYIDVETQGRLERVTNLTKYAVNTTNYFLEAEKELKVQDPGFQRRLLNILGGDKKRMESAVSCLAVPEKYGAAPVVFAPMIYPALEPFLEWLNGSKLLHSTQEMSFYLLDAEKGRASRYGAMLLPDWPSDSGRKFTGVVLVNSTALHGIPTFLNILHTTIYRRLSGKKDANITITNHPFPFTNAQHGTIRSIQSFITVLFIVIAFAFIPASFAVFIVKEREVNAKHQQLISGVSIPAYWLSTYVWDMINYIPPLVISVVMIVAFDITELINGGALGATIMLFVFYGLSVAAFTYVLSYLFKSHSTAQTVILVANLSCLVLLLASFIMHQIPSTCKADRSLRFVYRLIPGYSLGNGLLRLSILQGLQYTETDCGELSPEEQFSQVYKPFSLDVAGWPLLYMGLEALFYFALAIVIDIFLSYPSLRQKLGKDKDVEDKEYQEDEDVQAEADRVARGAADGESIVVKNLRKVYGGKKVAIRNLNFGIPEGNVFGFLGINGAGKTTTLKILSGDLLPTRGTAKLAGKDVLTQQIECRRMLGYCPQFDALFELLTVREHLELFAKIKGVPDSMLENVVQAKMHEMGVKQFENKCAGTLSGGNKRKLSVALAMIGDPSIVFLDEPSTGMDPMARRFMWDVIERIATKNKRCSIILTTHSMEECEALCTNVGIMVGGRLRCLGSVQHLKGRFGKGYLLEAKLKPPSEERIETVAQEIERFFRNNRTEPSENQPASISPGNLSELCEFLGDSSRYRMIHPDGAGWVLVSQLKSSGQIDVNDFAEWWAFETIAARFNLFVEQNFEGAYLVERHGDFLRFKLPELSMPLSKMFGLIEDRKSELCVSTYALSQTTLEQIFNIFASQQEEETGNVRGMAREPSESKKAPAKTENGNYQRLDD